MYFSQLYHTGVFFVTFYPMSVSEHSIFKPVSITLMRKAKSVDSLNSKEIENCTMEMLLRSYYVYQL